MDLTLLPKGFITFELLVSPWDFQLLVKACADVDNVYFTVSFLTCLCKLIVFECQHHSSYSTMFASQLLCFPSSSLGGTHILTHVLIPYTLKLLYPHVHSLTHIFTYPQTYTLTLIHSYL